MLVSAQRRSRNPITWDIADEKGEEVTPGIKTKRVLRRASMTIATRRFCFVERNAFESRDRLPLLGESEARSRAIDANVPDIVTFSEEFGNDRIYGDSIARKWQNSRAIGTQLGVKWNSIRERCR